MNKLTVATLFLLINSSHLPVLWAAESNEAVDPEFIAFFAAIYNDPIERASLRLDDFAETLAITNLQQSAWSELKQRLLIQFEKKRERFEDFRLSVKARNGKPLSTPESMTLKIENLEQQLKDKREIKRYIDKLYLLLDENQKSIFDQGMRALWYKNKMRQRRY